MNTKPHDNMLIIVCGMREPDNIRDVDALDIDLMGFIFYPKSSRYVEMISSHAGIMPDYSAERLQTSMSRHQKDSGNGAAPHRHPRVGVFVDDMPQNIVTRIYNYKLDYIQLHGDESAVMIDNLRRTVADGIAPAIKIIKAIPVATEADIDRAAQYDGVADMLLFDTNSATRGGSGQQFCWQWLDRYRGTTPFLLSGGIGPDDADKVLQIKHDKMAGIDINSRFETAPGVKDVERLKRFITKIRQHEQDKHTL